MSTFTEERDKFDGAGGSHEAGCRIAFSHEYGWEVTVEVDGYRSTIHCSDWHRVERICARVRQGILPAFVHYDDAFADATGADDVTLA